MYQCQTCKETFEVPTSWIERDKTARLDKGKHRDEEPLTTGCPECNSPFYFWINSPQVASL